jgi:hypothetical protein
VVTCSFADTGGSGLKDVQCGGTTGTNGEASLAYTLDTASLGAKSFTVSATDAAGNSYDFEYSYSVVDRVKPTASASPVSGGVYDFGAAVTVTCTFADAGGSGLASVDCGSGATPVAPGVNGPISKTLTLDTSTLGAKTFTVSAIDGSGNAYSFVYSYSVVDRVKPTATASPASGGTYDFGTTQVATCSFADTGGSGLKNVQCGDTTGTNGESSLTHTLNTLVLGTKTIKVSATDGAGNSYSFDYTYTVVDSVKPTITVSPASGGSYDFGSSVTLTCTFADSGGSGLASVNCGSGTVAASGNGPVTKTRTLDTSSLGAKSVTITAVDGSGNTTTTVYDYVVLDRVAPTATASPASGGTYNFGAAVAITCAFADTGGSGLKSVQCGDTIGTNAASLSYTLNTSTLGTKTIKVSATDVANNAYSFDYTYVVVDTVKPTIAVSPASGGTYTLGSTQVVTCTFADSGGSALASVNCGSGAVAVSGNGPITKTQTLDTSSLGAKSFIVSAVDGSGNSASMTYNYTVTDTWDCDPAGDSSIASADIVRCAAKTNGDGTATLSIVVKGSIDFKGTKYSLRLASSKSSTGTAVTWVGSGSATAPGTISGKPLIAASISPSDSSRIDFKVRISDVGCKIGDDLYWSAEVKSGSSVLDKAPNSGYFELHT